tara:strand:+ start:309 stop:608 length:300 start_codon:yes stop_codon:yes gene_type:complete
MKNIMKYEPNFCLINGSVIDLVQLDTLEVKKEITHVYKVKQHLFSPDEFSTESRETGRFYVWIRTQGNIINKQIYFSTEEQAKKLYNRIKKVAGIKELR